MGESSSIKGLRKNMFNILDGQHNIHDNATLVDESNAKDGVVAAVKGPNRPIIDTGYYEMNELVGLHQLKIRWFGSITSGPGVVVQYWKKDVDGNESHVDFPIPWMSDISPIYGNSAKRVYFSPNYQYRIKVISDPSILDTDYVAVDYFNVLPVDDFGVTSYISTSSDQTPESLTTVPIFLVVTGNGGLTGVLHYSYSSNSTTILFQDAFNINIQATAQNTNENLGWTANVGNIDSNGFDLVVSTTNGNWNGTCGVYVSISGFVGATSI